VIGGFQVGAFQTNFQQAAAVRVVHVNLGAGADGQSWQEAVQGKFDALHTRLAVEVSKERKIIRRIAVAKKKIAKAENPEGILANLHLLEMQKQELRKGIKELRLQIEWVKLEFEDPDEDDEEILLLQ
jgi:hypothetical protein